MQPVISPTATEVEPKKEVVSPKVAPAVKRVESERVAPELAKAGPIPQPPKASEPQSIEDPDDEPAPWGE